MSTQDGWARLGQAVVAERVKRGMRTTKALADRVGITPRLAGDIENGRRTSYSSGTKAALEAALDWAPGSVDAVVRGGAPVHLEVREVSRSALDRGALTFRGPSPLERELEARLAEHQPRDLTEAHAMLRAVSRRLQEAVEEWAEALAEAERAEREVQQAYGRREWLQRRQGELNELIRTLEVSGAKERDDRGGDSAPTIDLTWPPGASGQAGVQVAQEADAAAPGVDVAADEVGRRRRALKADQIAADQVPNAARDDNAEGDGA